MHLRIGLLVLTRFQKLARIMARQHDASVGFDGNTSINGDKLVYPAANRNKEPILEVLKRFVNLDYEDTESSPLFLEISSGSGQHIAHFAPYFPGIKFQPSEFDKTLLGSIVHYSEGCESNNVLKPTNIDIRNKLSDYGFMENSIDYIYNANMMHITPFECSVKLFENAGAFLKHDALMITYGPYSKDGIISSQSNVAFNESLKSNQKDWGLRDISELIQLAEKNNLILIDNVEMPANNNTLIWKKC